jgi:DNA-binding NtrC family response regulator
MSSMSQRAEAPAPVVKAPRHHTVLYAGCPPVERREVEGRIATGQLKVSWIDTLPEATAELQRRDIPIVVDLGRAATLQFLRELRVQRPAAMMFAVVDAGRGELALEATVAGVDDVFSRPVEGRPLLAAIERASRQRGRETDPAIGPPDHLYCQSRAMRSVAVQVANAGAARGSVMIKGRDHTGRQVTARAIHAATTKGAAAPFVVVDCAEHGPDQLAIELFGAGIDSAGHGRDLEPLGPKSRLAEAFGGTLYLKNLAEAPTRVQARLARIARDREVVMSAGGERAPVDVRFITSVEADADAAVREGYIKLDLFKRLSGTVIEMPPLRKRQEDVPLLVNVVMRDLCAAAGLAPKAWSRPALSLLAALPWRENVQELTAVLRGILADALPGTIRLDDVLRHVQLDGSELFAAGTLREARARFEREYILRLLEQHRGRMTEAARTLGIQRTNLYRKLRMLKIPRDAFHSGGSRSS